MTQNSASASSSKNNTFVKKWQDKTTITTTKKNSFCHPRAEVKVISGGCYADSFGAFSRLRGPHTFSRGNLPPSWQRGREGTLLRSRLAFRQIREARRAFLIPASSQLSSAQNNAYAKMALFWSGIICYLHTLGEGKVVVLLKINKLIN